MVDMIQEALDALKTLCRRKCLRLEKKHMGWITMLWLNPPFSGILALYWGLLCCFGVPAAAAISQHGGLVRASSVGGCFTAQLTSIKIETKKRPLKWMLQKQKQG